MHRAYLVSQGAHLAGWPEDGVRDVLSAARPKGTNHHRRRVIPDALPFWPQLRADPRQALATYWSRRFKRTFTCVSRTLYLAFLAPSCSAHHRPSQVNLEEVVAVASHDPVTQIARTGEVTPVPWGVSLGETRHLERCRSYRTETRLGQTRITSNLSQLDNKNSAAGATSCCETTREGRSDRRCESHVRRSQDSSPGWRTSHFPEGKVLC